MLLCSLCCCSDLQLLSPAYPALANTSIDDIPTEEYQSALEGFVK